MQVLPIDTVKALIDYCISHRTSMFNDQLDQRLIEIDSYREPNIQIESSKKWDGAFIMTPFQSMVNA